MADKPIILAVDDEPAVLSAVARDLRRQYGNHYRILRATSGDEALETLEQLKLRNDAVALFVADQRMPKMTGVEFLTKAVELYPQSKRVLLTAYADTEAAIKAINDAGVDHYLMKPWDPPEENLYPVLDDLLDDWQATFVPPFEGIRVVGHKWSARSHEVKDFLVRNVVPYRWLDVEADEEARQLVDLADADESQLPVVVLADGTQLVHPTLSEVAERIGLDTRPKLEMYDLIIVGGGPAGLAAAVYGGSEGLNTLLIEREAPGGQAGTSSRIENYLGFPSGISGALLTRHARDQATKFGVQILTPLEATGLRSEDLYRFISLSDGSEVGCQALIVASGVSYRKLDAPGVERLTGAGIYYGAAITEAESCRGEDVFIVGAGNSAAQAAIYLAERGAKSVTLLVRGDSLAASMSQYLIDRIEESATISYLTNSQVSAADGGERLESVTVKSSDPSEERTLPAYAMFIFIGAAPRTEWVADTVERDKYGFIYTGPDTMVDGHRPKNWNLDRDPFYLETSAPGIFVAGDVRHESIKRIASAVGEGSMAVTFVHRFLNPA